MPVVQGLSEVTRIHQVARDLLVTISGIHVWCSSVDILIEAMIRSQDAHTAKKLMCIDIDSFVLTAPIRFWNMAASYYLEWFKAMQFCEFSNVNISISAIQLEDTRIVLRLPTLAIAHPDT